MSYNFNCYKEKLASRYETIVKAYRELFKRDSLVGDYVTLCANQTEGPGVLSKGSELYQLLQEKFLSEDRFHGVDYDPATIELNETLGMANWYCEDVYKFLVDNISKLNPTVVNLDTVFYSKRRASHLLADTLLLLTDNTEGECLVSLNVMVNNCYVTHSVTPEVIEKEESSLIKELEESHSYKCAVKDGGWVMGDKCYLYSSTEKTVMCTYIFYRL
jgi:hypothetical protein